MSNVFKETLEGKKISTGDIIATVDGEASFYGLFSKIIGELIPGRPDHIVIYLGPVGICIEAAPKGVDLFRFFGERWDAQRMKERRGMVDTLFGIGNILRGRYPDPIKEEKVQETVRTFALDQVGKRYNMNFLDVDGENSFYCSQLAYAAYKRVGINLNVTGGGGFHPKFLSRIITPEEVWKACTPLS